MANGNGKFKMGRWGWAFVVGGLVFFGMWALYGFTNPFSRVMNLISGNGNGNNGNGNGTKPACASLGLDATQTAEAKAQGRCV